MPVVGQRAAVVELAAVKGLVLIDAGARATAGNPAGRIPALKFSASPRVINGNSLLIPSRGIRKVNWFPVVRTPAGHRRPAGRCRDRAGRGGRVRGRRPGGPGGDRAAPRCRSSASGPAPVEQSSAGSHQALPPVMTPARCQRADGSSRLRLRRTVLPLLPGAAGTGRNGQCLDGCLRFGPVVCGVARCRARRGMPEKLLDSP